MALPHPENFDNPIDENFWNEKYDTQNLGWDLGEISPPLKAYIDQLTRKDLRILIPGCGNCYEAKHLLQQGFTNITLIDIVPSLVEKLEKDFETNPNIKIICGNFFDHVGEYDLVLEQTFFCALHPSLREKYVSKMNSLLAANGKLAGVLFDREFDQPGPPFGGISSEYFSRFANDFNIQTFESCYNSFSKRMDTELFFILQKKQA